MKKKTERRFWVNGKHGGVTCITVTDYGHKIVATADIEQLTECVALSALQSSYSSHSWEINDGEFYGTPRVIE